MLLDIEIGASVSAFRIELKSDALSPSKLGQVCGLLDHNILRLRDDLGFCSASDESTAEDGECKSRR
jgi:hypothetical protein